MDDPRLWGSQEYYIPAFVVVPDATRNLAHYGGTANVPSMTFDQCSITSQLKPK